MKKIKFSLFFFYLSYTLILFQAMFNSTSSLVLYFGIIDKLTILFLIMTYLFQNPIYKIKEILIILLIFLITILSYSNASDNIILKSFLLIIAFKDINFKKFIKYDFILKILFSLIVITFSKFGISENYVILRADGTIRQSLGFSHPNALAAYWLSIMCDYTYLYFNKSIGVKLIVCAILTLIIGNITDSRTVIICIVFMCLLFLMKKYLNKKIIKKVIVTLPILLFSLSLYSGIMYNSSNLIKNIDIVLSKRIYYTEQFISKYDIKLLGQEIETVSTLESRALNIPPSILDNSYIILLLKFGLLVLIMFLVLLALKIKESYKYNDIKLVIVLLIFIISGVFEAWLIKVNYNPFILAFSTLIYGLKNKKDMKIENV